VEASVGSVRDVAAAGVDNHTTILRLQGDGAHHEAVTAMLASKHDQAEILSRYGRDTQESSEPDNSHGK
jgi:hypothetical protein